MENFGIKGVAIATVTKLNGARYYDKESPRVKGITKDALLKKPIDIEIIDKLLPEDMAIEIRFDTKGRRLDIALDVWDESYVTFEDGGEIEVDHHINTGSWGECGMWSESPMARSFAREWKDNDSRARATMISAINGKVLN